MAKKAKGKRPTFFADPQVDKVMGIVMALAGEVAVLRDRLDTVERVLVSRGVLTPDAIESYRPDLQVAEARERWRMDYLDRVLRVVREELEAVERGEVASESYESVVRAVSS
ncbi:MAG: hypothetical protein AB7G75_13070 [Candidatus Binatia bacterium]